MIDDGFLADIARQYNEHVAAGRMPGPRIAEAEGVPVRRVHRWVGDARKRGMLPPGTPPGLCGGAIPKKPLGTAGLNVCENIRRIRAVRGLSLRALSAELKKIGYTLSPDAINKIENGRAHTPGTGQPGQFRRVSVDDLAAFAAAFGVAPAQLMEPPAECATCHGAPPPGFACTECGTTAEKES
jgi:transcriptional regulator with XRE-family HTH domain